PLSGVIRHLALDAGAHLRIRESRPPRLEAALLHPGWHRAVETSGAGGVGVDIRRHREPCSSCFLNAIDDPLELPPVGLAGSLEVVDLGANAGLAGEGLKLLECLEQQVLLTG